MNQISIDELATKIEAIDQRLERAHVHAAGAFADAKAYSEFQADRVRDEMKAGFNRVDQRFEQVGDRFKQVDKRFDQTDGRFDTLDQRFNQMDERFSQFDRRFDRLEKRLFPKKRQLKRR